MNIQKFTQKSVEAINDCEKLAYEYGNQEIARISKNYLRNAKEITIGRKNESTSNVKHVVYTVHAKINTKR